MIHSALPSASPRNAVAGFSLVEVTLALAIIATAFVGILGVLPAGMDASQRAQSATVVANVLDHVHHRLQGEPLKKVTNKAEDASFSPVYFDVQGTPLQLTETDADRVVPASAFYRAKVQFIPYDERPDDYTSDLTMVQVSLTWPVNATTGEARGKSASTITVNFPVTPLTSPDWKDIAEEYSGPPRPGSEPGEPKFKPTIEF